MISPSLTLTTILEAVSSHDATMTIPGFIAGPYDLSSSAAAGSYTYFAARSNEIRVFDLEY